MEIEINIKAIDDDTAVKDAVSLKKQLQFYLPEIKVSQLERKLDKHEAGVSILDAAVKLVFGSEFVDKIIDLLKTWIETKSTASKTKLSIRQKDGDREIVMELDGNTKNLKELKEMMGWIVPQDKAPH